jgi:hypothetical protein
VRGFWHIPQANRLGIIGPIADGGGPIAGNRHRARGDDLGKQGDFYALS